MPFEFSEGKLPIGDVQIIFGTKYLIDDNQTAYQVNNDLRLN